MDPISIIEKYYDTDSKTYRILIEHSKSVTKKALEIAELNKEKNPDIQFIKEAAMLHDIGLFMINSKWFGCNGTAKYAAHGYLGAELLRKEGYPKHAQVCETHTGVGIFKGDIRRFELGIPIKDYIPQTTEEEIIAVADKFFSKSRPTEEKTIHQITDGLRKISDKHAERFTKLCRKYKLVKEETKQEIITN